MELFLYLRSLTCCCCSSSSSLTSKTTTYHLASNTTTFVTTVAAIKSRLSSTISDLFKDRQQEARQDMQERGEEDCSLIDAARSTRIPPSPSRPLVFGTVYGRRRGHVSFCVQQDPATLPPFLFEFSMTTDLLAREMATGLVRIALECPRNSPEHHPPSSAAPAPRRSLRAGPLWKAFCNGRKVGYAVKRSPSVRDLRILNTVRSMSGGAGVLPCMDGDDHDDGAEKGELMYMRASYERVMGSRDSVAYHLINPGGSPAQELSVFLVRSG